MTSNPRTIPAGEFKNRCLALMDEVNETGEEIVITKHGKPVSRLVPAVETETANVGPVSGSDSESSATSCLPPYLSKTGKPLATPTEC